MLEVSDVYALGSVAVVGFTFFKLLVSEVVMWKDCGGKSEICLFIVLFFSIIGVFVEYGAGFVNALLKLFAISGMEIAFSLNFMAMLGLALVFLLF